MRGAAAATTRIAEEAITAAADVTKRTIGGPLTSEAAETGNMGSAEVAIAMAAEAVTLERAKAAATMVVTITTIPWAVSRSPPREGRL
mmetsp:Transcript_36595/g.100716  ORF Transcript_36595/g.100716 Transcript_36595/m.100716 type:complete len:88 (-) Transcript_36595:105-368(-)